MTRDDGSVLIDAAIRGEPDAIRSLWQEHRRWVAAIVLAHKPREMDLEDLLQDVAMSYVRKVRELREPEAFRPWLRTVAVNAARAAGRERTRRKAHNPAIRLHSAAVRPLERDAGAEISRREEAQRLMGLALQLPEGYREPLLLRCVQGMSYRRISELTGLPETTVETRIARGRRMLRELAARDEQITDRGHEPAEVNE